MSRTSPNIARRKWAGNSYFTGILSRSGPPCPALEFTAGAKLRADPVAHAGYGAGGIFRPCGLIHETAEPLPAAFTPLLRADSSPPSRARLRALPPPSDALQ